MASVGDYIFLAIVLAIIGGIVYAIKEGGIDEGIIDAKQNLEQRGISLYNSGVSIKTDRRAPTRDEYIDRTRDHFVKGSETIMSHRDAFTTTVWERENEAQKKLKQKQKQKQR